jgi:SAM-dependent methyltransferase
MSSGAWRPDGPPPAWTIGDEHIRRLERRYYPGYVDEHVLFDEMIMRYFRPGNAVLDAGAGRGLRYDFTCRTQASRFAGVDLNPAVRENPLLTDAAVADLAALPYDDSSFDLVISKYVFEHLDRPADVMSELRRVSRPGAHLVVHTPNRWHYVALSAHLTPTRFHRWFNEQRARSSEDTFPTRYRANDRRTLMRLARRTGYRIVELRSLETKPDYLFFHPLAYRAGVVYQRTVDRWPWLAGLRVQLMIAMRAT